MRISFKSALFPILVRGALLALVAFAGMASPSDATAQQTQVGFSQGHAICGAMDLRTGNVLPPCGFAKATKTGKAVGSCPKGSFFDIGTWSCFTCPRGFNRTGFAVDTPQACSKEVKAEYKYAKRIGNHKSCPTGSFKDDRNGGECWACPSGYGRTLSAVDAWDACGKAFETARRAEFIDRVCAEGTFPDLNGGCYTCPTGFRRTAAAVTGHNACFRNEELRAANKEAALTCKAGEHFDFIDGGTCWSCPENSVRSVSGVKTNQACEYTNMRWEAAKRTPNGLFALPGGHEIAAQVILERKGIDAAIAKFIKESKYNKSEGEKYAADAWELIRTAPESSPILMAVTYDYVFNLVKNGAKTKPERDLLDYLAVYVQQSRQLSASEMKNVWDSWVRGQQALTASRGNNMVNAYDTGVAPPDMRGLVAQVMHLGPPAAIAMTFMGAYALSAASPEVSKFTLTMARTILPFRKSISTALQTVARTGAASTAGVTGAVAAPLIIMTAASIIASMATDIAVQQNKQESIVNDALQTAQQPVNLARLLLTDDGRTEVAANWALMTQEPVKPNARTWAALMPTPSSTGNTATVNVNGTNIVVDVPTVPSVTLEGDRVVVSRVSGSAPSWEKVDGAAHDVAVGSDGTIYAIGVKKVGGGYEIFSRAKTADRWTKLSGAATRIAASGTEAWVVNDQGMIFVQSGKGWKKVPGPAAQDIGASAKGVWIIGVDEKIYQRVGNTWKLFGGKAQRIDVDEDGRPWIVTKVGQIYVHTNNLKWHKLPGAATDVAVDARGAAYVVGTSGGVFVFNGTKRDWDRISDDKDSVAIGVGGGQVWRVSKSNETYQFH
jgi:hypothetical protein